MIKWRKSGDSSVTFPNGLLLRLTSVQKKDAGFYECEADNGIAAPDVARAIIVVQCKYKLVCHEHIKNLVEMSYYIRVFILYSLFLNRSTKHPIACDDIGIQYNLPK